MTKLLYFNFNVDLKLYKMLLYTGNQDRTVQVEKRNNKNVISVIFESWGQ